MSEQLVRIQLPGPISEAEISALDGELQILFAEGIPGEYDGYDGATDGSGGTLYFYGADAAELFVQIFPELAVRPLTKAARVTLRFGPPEDGVEEHTFLMSDVTAGEKQ